MEAHQPEHGLFTKVRGWENLHIILWLGKDISWLLNWKVLGMVMITPTLGLALFLCWYTRHLARELAFNLAVTCWIAANGIWMTGEFFYNDGTRPIALWFFIAGFLFIGRYYLLLWMNRSRRM